MLKNNTFHLWAHCAKVTPLRCTAAKGFTVSLAREKPRPHGGLEPASCNRTTGCLSPHLKKKILHKTYKNLRMWTFSGSVFGNVDFFN